MYLQPDKFFEKMDNEDRKGILIHSSSENYDLVEQLINEMKVINSLDTDFIYTCRCDNSNTKTAWYFAYTNDEIRDKAIEIVNKYDEKFKNKYPNINTEDMTGGIIFYNECQCPFGD